MDISLHTGPVSWSGKRLMWATAIIFLLNLFLKALYLGANDIAMDEPFTLFWSAQSWSDLWEMFRHENNPPLHFWVEHFWIKIGGLDPNWVRLPFLLFSALTAPVIFRTANRHFGAFAGIVAGTAFTLSSEHYLYAHEARTYALFCLLAALAVQQFLHVRTRPMEWKGYLWLALWNALMLYCHYLGGLIILAQGLAWLLFFPDKLQTLQRMLALAAATLLLFSPGIYLMVVRLDAYADGGTWVQPPAAYELYAHISRWLNGGMTVKLLLLGIPVALGWRLIARGRADLWARLRENTMLWLVLTLWLSLFLGQFLISVSLTPMFIPRYVIYLSPLFYLLLGAGMAVLFSETDWRLIPYVALVAGMLYRLDLNTFNNRDVHSLLATTERMNDAHTRVVICPPWWNKTYLYHLDKDLFAQGEAAFAQLEARGYHSVHSWPELEPSLGPEVQKVLYIDVGADAALPDNGLHAHLSERFPQQTRLFFLDDLRLTVYAPQGYQLPEGTRSVWDLAWPERWLQEWRTR